MAEADATLVVRPGLAGDVTALRALGEAVVPATYGPLDPAYAAMMLETWWATDRLADSLQRLPHVVAEVDDELVGVANLGHRDDRWVMWKLYVRPDHQGLGIGRRLLTEIVRLVEGDALWLEHVDGNDAAAGFYRAQGFVEVERVPQPPYPDDVWMRKDL
jgi:ribosomal protein S18 acetylase RimI-like enzyme